MKPREGDEMKNKILKVIELVAKWGTVMLITSLLQIILTDKQLIGLVLFVVLLIDDRTFNTHDLLKDKAVTIDKIHVITKQLYLDAECNTKKVREMDDKLSNIENKASKPTQTKKFTLED